MNVKKIYEKPQTQKHESMKVVEGSPWGKYYYYSGGHYRGYYGHYRY